MDKAVFNGSITKQRKLADLKNLKNIIKNIALGHAREISIETEIISSDKREFDVVKLVQELVLSQRPNTFNQETVNREAKILEDSVKTIMDSSILVKDQGLKQLVPLSYEVLRLIFSSTNEQFRQYFALTEYYYQELTENLKTLSVKSTITKGEFDHQVKVLLPIVKFETAIQFAQSKDPDSQELLQEIISNLKSFFKYIRLNQEDIYVIVNSKLNSNKYKLLSYELTPLDERNGHLGEYYKLKIDVEFENKKLILSLFAKFLTPKLEIMKEIIKSGPSKKEEFFYQTYLPLFKEHGLESLLDFAPKCYFSRIDDVLVLDDMTTLGFSALTPNIKLEFDALMYLVKKMANLHAGSMILEEILNKSKKEQLTLYDRYPEYLQETLLTESNLTIKKSCEDSWSTVHYIAQKYPDYAKIFADDHFNEKADAIWKRLYEQVKRSDQFKNTVCHGDMYVSNMLFKFSNQGRCEDAILVDYQLLRYCPPVQDLCFFIYQNSFKETRDKHYHQLIDGYYQELSKHFENVNLNIDKIYSKENFENSLKYMKSGGVVLALFYSQVNALEPGLRERIFQDEELAKKYLFGDKAALVDLGFEDNNYKRALSGLVADLIEIVNYESVDL